MDETTRSELRTTIRALRRTANTANNKDAFFFSQSEVTDAIKEKDVCACLRLALKSVPQDEASRKNATLVPYLLTNERDISRLAKEIIKSSILIFATLLLENHELFICEFVFRRDCDARLPFSKDALYYLNDEVVEKFRGRQWEFCPTVLRLHELRRTLHHNEVVPFVEQEKIGSGAFGAVWKAKLYHNCHKLNSSCSLENAYARKVLSNKDIPADKERAVLELVRELKHPNIVELLSAFRQGNDSNLIFPLADMNLREFLEGRKECQMEIHEIYTSIHGLADALRQIHDFFLAAEGNSTSEIRKIGCHHDLRPNNILVQHGVFVIADFGLSKLAPDNEDSKTPLRGLQSDDYLPPEATHDSNGCRRTGSVGRASDNWAFGCILTELATFIEGKNVDDFMESRKVTIRGIYEETNTVFHFNGRVRPAVEKWLDVLEEQPRDRQTTRLIKVARRLMDPDVNKRAKASEVVSDLKVLAIESTYNAIRRAFLNTLEEPGKTFMCLEQMRVQTWWREYHIYELNNTEGDVLSRLQNLERCLRPNTVAELPQSMLSGLPQNILNSVDALCAMLQDEKRRNFASSWCQTVSDIDDTKILSAIRQAPKGSRYREVGISATMKEMNLAVQDSMKEMDLTFQNPKDLRQGSRILKRELIELDDELPFMSNPVEGRYPDKSKTMGYFDTQKENQEGDERVLIEWKEYRGDWKGHGKKQLSSMDRLTDLLDPDVTPLPPAMKSKVLACRGYFHEEHNQRFGFVYSLPATDGDYAAKLFSLNDVLYLADEKNSKLPDLGGIFQLAKDLGSCLLQVHEAGWLHKNISSHNLLIFTPNKDLPNQNVRSAVLCGFNDSRLEAAGYTLGPEGESRHYKYPAYIKDVTFSRAFDYYSLGIVLLEMGLSTTMARLIQRDDRLKSTQGFWQRLLESYVPQLGGEMGSLFMDAVQFCLNAYDYGLAEEHPRELHEKFRKEVVESLALCVA